MKKYAPCAVLLFLIVAYSSVHAFKEVVVSGQSVYIEDTRLYIGKSLYKDYLLDEKGNEIETGGGIEVDIAKVHSFKGGEHLVVIAATYIGDDLQSTVTEFLYYDKLQFKIFNELEGCYPWDVSFDPRSNEVICTFRKTIDHFGGFYVFQSDGVLLKEFASDLVRTSEDISLAYDWYKDYCSPSLNAQLEESIGVWSDWTCADIDDFQNFIDHHDWFCLTRFYGDVAISHFDLDDLQKICKNTCITDVVLSAEQFEFAMSKIDKVEIPATAQVSPNKVLALRESGKKPVIAILDFSPATQNEQSLEIGMAFATSLRTEAVKSQLFEVVERHKIKSLIDEGHFGDTDISRIPAERIGQFLAAQYVLTGDCTLYKGKIKFTASLINVKDSTLLLADEVFADDDLNDIANAAKSLYSKMMGIIMPKS